MTDLPIGYRDTEDPDRVEVFCCASAIVDRYTIETDQGRFLVAAQLYEAAARVAHERLVHLLVKLPTYEKREPLSRVERVESCLTTPPTGSEGT